MASSGREVESGSIGPEGLGPIDSDATTKHVEPIVSDAVPKQVNSIATGSKEEKMQMRKEHDEMVGKVGVLNELVKMIIDQHTLTSICKVSHGEDVYRVRYAPTCHPQYGKMWVEGLQ